MALLLQLWQSVAEGPRYFFRFCDAHAGAITALATVALVLCTAAFIIVVWLQGRTMRRQTELQAERAVCTIVLELTLNADMTKLDEYRMLLDSGQSLLWSLVERGAATETMGAVGTAYASIKDFNTARQSLEPDWQKRAWLEARVTTRIAELAVAKDPATVEQVDNGEPDRTTGQGS